MAKRRQTFERAARKRKAAQRARAAEKLLPNTAHPSPESKLSRPAKPQRAKSEATLE
jgi:hypothetical protein